AEAPMPAIVMWDESVELGPFFFPGMAFLHLWFSRPGSCLKFPVGRYSPDLRLAGHSFSSTFPAPWSEYHPVPPRKTSRPIPRFWGSANLVSTATLILHGPDIGRAFNISYRPGRKFLPPGGDRCRSSEHWCVCSWFR